MTIPPSALLARADGDARELYPARGEIPATLKNTGGQPGNIFDVGNRDDNWFPVLEIHSSQGSAQMAQYTPPAMVVAFDDGDPTTTDNDYEYGVILHETPSWLTLYVPGTVQRVGHPADLEFGIRNVSASRIECRYQFIQCPAEWVVRGWNRLLAVGPELLGAPTVAHVWELSAHLLQHKLDEGVGPLLPQGELERMVGRALTDQDINKMRHLIAWSLIPQVLRGLVQQLDVPY
ncbi:hypothetical protein D5S17_35700 [Pseudonocardiaceae bacterium YIM PH 21723]|nr:hypothetical protein D5S17_35700 [Pseudonocardiaceae bacterium YIM PH 21723]